MVWLANPERYGQMQYRYCGKSGLRLPALSLGLWHNFGHVNALESQRAILRKAFDLGITHFDLANTSRKRRRELWSPAAGGFCRLSR